MPRTSMSAALSGGGAGRSSGLTQELLRSTCQIPGLPQTLLAILESLSRKDTSDLKPADVANSELVLNLIQVISEDYDRPASAAGGGSNDYHLACSQRVSKLRLLSAALSMVLPDLKSKQMPLLVDMMCKVLRHCASSNKKEGGAKLEEQLAVLQTLQLIVTKCPSAIEDKLGEVLGYLAVLIGLHRQVEGLSLVPTNLPHLQFNQRENEGSRRESSNTDTSGSDYSDQEMMPDSISGQRRRREDYALEKQAIQTLGIIVKKCHKKPVVSYWFIFLPDKSFCPLQTGVTELLRHPSKKLRVSACHILTDFIAHTTQFLALAQHQDKGTSYTSLSTALSLALYKLHQVLFNRIKDQLNNTEYVAILKLFCALCENCTYSRLNPGLVETMVESLMVLSESQRNPVIQVASLSVFVSLGQGPSLDSMKPVTMDLFSFILPRCFPVPQNQVADNNVRYMALQGLSVLAQIHIMMFVRKATEVKKLIDTGLVDSDPSVVLHTFRFIKNFAKYLTEEVTKNSESASRLRNLTVAFWVDFLKPANFQLLESLTNPNIRSAFADCLAEIGPDLYTDLPDKKRIVCITYILGQCRNVLDVEETNPEVILQDRSALSASLRALGIFIMYPCYLTDTTFHMDVTDALLPNLPLVKDKKGKNNVDPGSKTVRVSASWALANLTDVLVQAKHQMELTGEYDEFPISLAKKILNTAIFYALDSNSAITTKSNVVRCIGNMLNYICADQLSPDDYSDLMERGTRALISNITTGKSMKVRWNACYAASNLLKKKDVTEESGKWIQDLVTSLSSLVQNFQNFKVRINAAVALGAVWGRPAVNSLLFDILESLVVGLESSQNLEVFGEYQHQSNLVQQLCLTMSHMITFINNEQEFSRLTHILHGNWDIVETSLTSCVRNIPPMKFTPILNAHNHISSFSPRNEEENNLQMLYQSCVENTH
eukprot:TRINITY_DN4123_c0_g1_i11.p1 TRINITY_DN4123_c0_g1~~TRINITY_DN4123_c0_g1_i11.p1  ORF type:complete len:943 (-),score=161.07 TRINITY_DN4123_c0_g1_i11:371-3199(-)